VFHTTFLDVFIIILCLTNFTCRFAVILQVRNLNILHPTWRWSSYLNTQASYSGSPAFESLPTDHLFWMWLCIYSLLQVSWVSSLNDAAAVSFHYPQLLIICDKLLISFCYSNYVRISNLWTLRTAEWCTLIFVNDRTLKNRTPNLCYRLRPAFM
jgi:hypothetical protein